MGESWVWGILDERMRWDVWRALTWFFWGGLLVMLDGAYGKCEHDERE